MVDTSLVMLDEEYKETGRILDKLLEEAIARVVFLVDKDGQLVASCGDEEGIDSTSLASLTAGNIAATGGLAKLLGQKEFSILFHQGEKENIHISLIGDRMILVVIFDTQSTLGLVRLRAKKAGEELNEIFQRLINKAKRSAVSSDALLSDITDEDIERLFS